MSFASPLGITLGARIAAYLATPDGFRRHRKRINKRLSKLRHELVIVTKDTRNYHEKEKTSVISPQLYDSDSRNGLLLLLLAERNVVHALEVKSEIEMSPERMTSRKKLMASKLKKAASTCQKLLVVTTNEPDLVKKIELYVYAAIVHGMYALIKKRWHEALYSFSLARCGLEFLSDQAENSSIESLSDSAVAELLDTLVDPSLNLAMSRYATSNNAAIDARTVARKHCHDETVAFLKPCLDHITKIDGSYVEEIEEEQVPKNITWRQHQATLHNDEIAVKLARLNRLDWRSLTEPEQFDGLYSQWSALVDLHTAELAKNKDEDDMLRVQDGAIFLTYLRYNMFFVRVRRDLLLVDKLASVNSNASCVQTLRLSKDALRLYSSINRTVSEIKDLPGVYNDDVLYQSLENLSLFFEAKRSLVVALCYSATAQASKALKILLHVKKTFSVSQDFYRVSEFPFDVTSYSQARELETTVSQQLLRVSALAQFLHTLKAPGTQHLCENVYKYDLSPDSITRVSNVDKIGGIKPVLCKPVLFDIAFNYIGYSGQETTKPVPLPEIKPEDEKKSGLFGIFGRG